MDLFDHSFVKLIVLLVLMMFIISCLYLFLRKNSGRSGFWHYSNNFPDYRRYMEIKKKNINSKNIDANVPDEKI